MRSAACDEDRVDFRVFAEPSGERFDLRQSAETLGQNMLCVHFLSLKEDEIVALRRRHVLRQFQEIQRNRQGHQGETTDFKATDAEQDSGRESVAEEFQSVFLAILLPGEHED